MTEWAMGRATARGFRRARVSATSVAVATLLASPAVSQFSPGPIWRQLPPIGGFATEFVYTDGTGALVAMGGSAPGIRTWRLGTGWQEVVTEPAPPNNSAASYVYDSHRGAVVVLGGWHNQPSAETWEFDGAAWSLRQPALAPSPRYGAAMAYDPIRRRCVLYGGAPGPVPFDDTWEYDGVTWTPVATVTTPQLTPGSGMVFDGNLQQVVLVGPSQVNVGLTCETWRFDGVDWHPIATASAPGNCVFARIAFDPVRHAAILAGGMDPSHFRRS